MFAFNNSLRRTIKVEINYNKFKKIVNIIQLKIRINGISPKLVLELQNIPCCRLIHAHHRTLDILSFSNSLTNEVASVKIISCYD